MSALRSSANRVRFSRRGETPGDTGSPLTLVPVVAILSRLAGLFVLGHSGNRNFLAFSKISYRVFRISVRDFLIIVKLFDFASDVIGDTFLRMLNIKQTSVGSSRPLI